MASRRSPDRGDARLRLDEWHPGDLLIEVLRFCGVVGLVGGVLLALLGVLSGSPEPLAEPFDNLGLIH
jgi:hypothetical protein